MTDTVLSEDLKPTNAVIAPATVSALQRLPGVDGAAAAALPQTLVASSAPAISAQASLIFAVVYGKLTVSGLPAPHAKCEYKADIWGLGRGGRHRGRGDVYGL